jgi:hypothetical protein
MAPPSPAFHSADAESPHLSRRPRFYECHLAARGQVCTVQGLIFTKVDESRRLARRSPLNWEEEEILLTNVAYFNSLLRKTTIPLYPK